FAVGTPHGLKRTFSSGILSNVDRTDLNTFTTVIQTDAAINPGNSGGPLFDRNGRVLGINTYGTRGANNLGFTIPIHVVEKLYHDLRDYGRFIRADLPLFQVRALYDELRTVLGVDRGVLVEYVMENSPAAAAGLQAGDVIVMLNGRAVSAVNSAELHDFAWAFSSLQIGGPLALEVLRWEGEGYARVSLHAMVEEAEPAIASGGAPGEITVEKYDALGLPFTRMVRQHRIRHQLQDDAGVLVMVPDNATPAQKAQLDRYDIITSVGGVAVHDVDSFRDALEARLAERDSFIELVVRRRQMIWRTALAPYYDLAGKHILVVLPPGDARYLDLVLRELVAQGAALTIASLDGAVDLPSKVIRDQVALADADVEDIDVLLLLDGDQADRYWENGLVLSLVREMYAQEKMLAALGASAITLLAADPAIIEKRITTSKGRSGEAIQRKAQYTGVDVEKDGNVLTGSGLDRQAVRDFLQELARAAR
ncbi:MAG: PDZ domain-containing protein, partial [Kiritimatiellia bacterium]